ncbi:MULTISPECIES: hypothetical protein [unclassified Sphingomonas]
MTIGRGWTSIGRMLKARLEGGGQLPPFLFQPATGRFGSGA